MEKAYIILAHKYPEQLNRLINRLNDGRSTFYIHIDGKSDISGFSCLPYDDRVIMMRRIKTFWAGHSLVDVTLEGLKTIRSSGRPVDRVILLSGQDYPIKDNRFINAYLESSPYTVFLEHTIIPDFRRWSPRGGLYRIDKYYFGLKVYQRFTAKALNFLSSLSNNAGRKAPKDMIPYAGSQWWVLDMNAVEYILDYVRLHPGYSRFHRYTFASDEVFFHMILLNAKNERLKKSIRNDDLHFITWENSDSSHPDILGEADLQEILESKGLFARKFDPETDQGILDLIDRHCLKNSNRI